MNKILLAIFNLFYASIFDIMDESVVKKLLKEKGIKANRAKIKKLVPRLTTVYTDIDGTLVGPRGCFFLSADGQYTLKPARTLIKALEKEIDIVLVSGRNIKQLMDDARLLGLKNYIGEMGAQIVHNQGQKIIIDVGDFPLTEGSAYKTMLKNGVLDLIFSSFPKKIEHHEPWSDYRECTAVLRGQVDADEVNRLLVANGFTNLKLVDNGRIERESDALDVKEMHAYHLIPAGVSKEGGVAKDRNLRKIPKNNCIAIGDAEADLAFASEVGAFFMVHNGLVDNSHLAEKLLHTPNVFICDKSMGEGWAQALDLFL
jgi:hypothetical protein